MKQPEALRLAEILESERITEKQELQAAAELRRLHEVNTTLLEALREIAELADKVDSWQSFPPEPIQKAYAAIAEATGEQA